MTKYNLILKYKTYGQKAQTIAEYLKHKYPEIIDVSYNIFKSYEEYRNICLTQQPMKLKRTFIKEYINAIHFLRPDYLKYFKSVNKTTNGFSVYSAYKKYDYFIPMMYEYKNDQNTGSLNIGYYFTPYRNNFKEFVCFLKQNFRKINNISILADQIYKDFYYPIIQTINTEFNIHSYHDKDEFFANITHLVFPMSKTFIDPWPTVLEEAVKCNKQIIILQQDRSWKDGIDDICSCIRYHINLDLNIYYDNSDSSILNFNLDKYYKYLFDNNFEFYIDRNKYKTFDEFLTRWEY